MVTRVLIAGAALATPALFALAAKIRFDEKTNTIELENYASERVRLQNVRLTVRTS